MRSGASAENNNISRIDELDHKHSHHAGDIIQVEIAVLPSLTTATSQHPTPAVSTLVPTHQHSSSSSHLVRLATPSPPPAASPSHTGLPSGIDLEVGSSVHTAVGAPLLTHHEPSFDILDNTEVPQQPDSDGNGGGSNNSREAEAVGLRQRVRQSAAARELTQLRPLVTSSVRSASTAAASFGRTSCASLVDYVRSSPSKLYTSAASFYANPAQLRLELLLGVSLSALLVVDGIAFSLTAGVLPIVGLYACFILTLFTSVFGGCPGMASGAAGSTAAVQAAITSDSGSFSHLSSEQRLQVLLFCLLLSGVWEVLVGWLGLAQLAILIPYTVMVGFMNGLAIIILESQLSAFQFCPTSSVFTDCTVAERQWLAADELTTWLTVIHALLAMLIMEFAHKIPIRAVRLIPPVLLAAVIGSAVEHGIFRAAIDHPTRTVKDTAAISGSLPTLSFPSTSAISSSDTGTIIYQSVLIAFVGLVESILTLNALNVKKQVRTLPADFNIESIAQGIGNIACSLTGALGGCALVGESALNIDGGSRSRLSTFISSWCICIYITVLYMVINLLPIAAVTGIMMFIVIHLFQWRTTFTAILRLRLSDAVIIYAVTAISVAVDLAIGVAVGIVLHALVFAYEMGQSPQFSIATKWVISDGTDTKAADDCVTLRAVAGGDDKSNGITVGDAMCTVIVRGVLYFGSVYQFVSDCHPDVLLTQSTTGTEKAAGAGEAGQDNTADGSGGGDGAGDGSGVVSVLLDMSACRLLDFSASCALDDVVNEWHKRGWSVVVSGVDEQQRMRLSLAQALTPSQQTLTWQDEGAQAVSTDGRNGV